MYKCTECGLEFDKKPEYCECGNDEFVLTIPNPEIPELQTQEVNISDINKTPKIAAELSDKNINNNYTTEKKAFSLPVHPVALVIFCLCIIFSLLIIFFWNPVKNSTDNIPEVKQTVENKKAIPSIDKLWKEPAPVIQSQKIHEVKTVEQEKKIAVVPLIKKPVQQKTVSVNKRSNKQQVKTAPIANKPQQKSSANVTSSVNKSQEEAKKAQEEAEKKALEAKQRAEAEALAAAEKAKKAAQAKQELYSYKINLRNAIGQKIDFTRVIGDGDCSVTFQLDSTGKLINRTFAKQSTNITLNNAVYNAVMATPSYYPPPSLYNNQTFRLNIKFYSGNFAITLD